MSSSTALAWLTTWHLCLLAVCKGEHSSRARQQEPLQPAAWEDPGHNRKQVGTPTKTELGWFKHMVLVTGAPWTPTSHPAGALHYEYFHKSSLKWNLENWSLNFNWWNPHLKGRLLAPQKSKNTLWSLWTPVLLQFSSTVARWGVLAKACCNARESWCGCSTVTLNLM